MAVFIDPENTRTYRFHNGPNGDEEITARPLYGTLSAAQTGLFYYHSRYLGETVISRPGFFYPQLNGMTLTPGKIHRDSSVFFREIFGGDTARDRLSIGWRQGSEYIFTDLPLDGDERNAPFCFRLPAAYLSGLTSDLYSAKPVNESFTRVDYHAPWAVNALYSVYRRSPAYAHITDYEQETGQSDEKPAGVWETFGNVPGAPPTYGGGYLMIGEGLIAPDRELPGVPNGPAFYLGGNPQRVPVFYNGTAVAAYQVLTGGLPDSTTACRIQSIGRFPAEIRPDWLTSGINAYAYVIGLPAEALNDPASWASLDVYSTRQDAPSVNYPSWSWVFSGGSLGEVSLVIRSCTQSRRPDRRQVLLANVLPAVLPDGED